ncbi:MAG: DUF4932 domain-containing protein [Phycisphaerae bacterium]|nr:DUF4932 domain-containing protein [Phycisphaerae bacterium]
MSRTPLYSWASEPTSSFSRPKHFRHGLLALCLLAAPTTLARSQATVGVDDRVELLTIVARLAGSPEFAMDNSRSPYADRVMAHFGASVNHPAIQAFAALRSEHGVSFDAVPSLALHLDGVPSRVGRIPFDQRPKRLDERWALEPTRDLLMKLRDFASVTKAAEFFAGEREFYAKVDVRLGAFVAGANSVPWFDTFLGAKATATYGVIPGLLCGSGNFGVGVVFNDGAPEELRPVLGCWSWDAEGLPVFDRDTYLPTYVHELCHSYTNPIVDRHLAELEPAANRMYPAIDRVMRRMAYTTGEIVLDESLVRACIIRYLADVEGSPAATREAEAEAQVHAGFTWVPDLATLFERYAKDRRSYPDLAAFVPEIARFFEARANALVDAAKSRDGARPATRVHDATERSTRRRPSARHAHAHL